MAVSLMNITKVAKCPLSGKRKRVFCNPAVTCRQPYPLKVIKKVDGCAYEE